MLNSYHLQQTERDVSEPENHAKNGSQTSGWIQWRKILLAVTLVINNKDYPERNAGIIDLQQDGRIVR